MKIDLYIGDICSPSVDVICISTNPHLELMAGTGGAVRDLGGWVIQDECNTIIDSVFQKTGNRYLPMGNVVQTSAGRLPYLAALMCVAIDPFHRSSVAIIAECTRNALKLMTAELPQAHSIAMPVFATGNGQFDFNKALGSMLNVLQQWPSCSIERCLIVVRDEPQIRTAQRVMTDRLSSYETWMQPDSVSGE